MPSPADLFAPAKARLHAIPWQAVTAIAPVLEAPLREVLDNRPADRTLDRFLRAHRLFDSATRAVTAEALFGVSLWRRRLRAQLTPDASPLHLLAALIENAGHEGAKLLNLTLPALRPLTNWRDETSTPDWLAEEYVALAKDEAPQLAASMNTPAPIFLRANTLLNTREQLAQKLAAHQVATSPTRSARDGLRIETPRPNLLGLGLNGHFEVQDEGSQLIAELLQAEPGMQVLDLCAGAGGKTLALAAHVTKSGLVHATDLDRARLERLRTRAVHAHARVAIHGPDIPEDLLVPRVLVDAPCSELGTLRRGPDLRWRIDPKSFNSLPDLQLELILRGLQHTAPHGRLVYATCTFRREENEAVVAEVLKRRPELTVNGPFFATRPDRDNLDGFFAATFLRENESPT